ESAWHNITGSCLQEKIIRNKKGGDVMLFQQGNLQVRKLEEYDKYFLEKWLSDADILKYYEGRDNPFNMEKVTAKFYGKEDDVVRCLVLFAGNPIGYFQFYPLEEKEVNDWYSGEEGIYYGMDQFIGEPTYWNRGIGTLLIRAACRYLTKNLRADKIVMDPQSWNTRAQKAYEKCGFNKVKLLPEHE